MTPFVNSFVTSSFHHLSWSCQQQLFTLTHSINISITVLPTWADNHFVKFQDKTIVDGWNDWLIVGKMDGGGREWVVDDDDDDDEEDEWMGGCMDGLMGRWGY